MATTTIKINGMTCDHCVKRVTKEISTIPGVSTVAVDLAAGQFPEPRRDLPRRALGEQHVAAIVMYDGDSDLDHRRAHRARPLRGVMGRQADHGPVQAAASTAARRA